MQNPESRHKAVNVAHNIRLHLIPFVLIYLSLSIIVGCTGVTVQTPPLIAHEKSPGIMVGYVKTADLPDSRTLLPPPPAPGSAAFAADQEAYRLTRALRNTPRWALAAKDADLTFPNVMETFSCALGTPITEEAVPHLYNLLRRSGTDACDATTRAKVHYQRTRPFVMNRETTCTPHDEAVLSKNGSYPSGHTSAAWTWALILAEIAPDRKDNILARGLAFGQSRVICGVHWQSDVDAGLTIAAGVVARLHAEQSFRAQIEVAKTELASVRAKGLKPTRDCRAEAAALAVQMSAYERK